MTRRILLILVAAFASVLLLANPVSAHNTLITSDPADGAVLAIAPTQLTLVFGKSVPLDTLSIEMIDATGVRSDLSGSVHGPNGDTEVLTPLPVLSPGEVTLRWKLVGPDGHPITGRIGFTISAPPATSPATTVAAPATSPPTTLTPGVAPPLSVVTSSTTSPVTTTPVSTPTTRVAEFEEPWTTSATVRWLLRFGSYVAIMTIGGVIATTAFVWSDAWLHPLIRRSVVWSLAFTLFAGLAQLLVIASDIESTPPWAASAGVSAALGTDAGRAFAIRIVLAAALAWVVFRARMSSDESRWSASVMILLGLLATWAFAGHSRSMRWSLLGVPVDVAHHAAAAAWIGGLAIIGLVAIRETRTEELIQIVNRFGQVAAVSVAVIVGTGVVQTLRLVGTPAQLFAADHGKYLFVKLVVLGAMLKVADINRQRVSRRLRSTATTTRLVVDNLRRAMGTELVVGLLIVAVTAVMVVSPPAVAEKPPARASTTATSLVTGTSVAVGASTANTQATVTACTVSGSTMQLGAAGLDVICLQQALTGLGLLDGAPTGSFDSATDAAVRSVQASRGLDIDGVVGPITAAALGISPAP
ncbi:MAG: copper resistance protein CopC [Actinobacteria bacterium]|nr:copper resistance protein CopC [Actinomycetota bacterium]